MVSRVWQPLTSGSYSFRNSFEVTAPLSESHFSNAAVHSSDEEEDEDEEDEDGEDEDEEGEEENNDDAISN